MHIRRHPRRIFVFCDMTAICIAKNLEQSFMLYRGIVEYGFMWCKIVRGFSSTMYTEERKCSNLFIRFRMQHSLCTKKETRPEERVLTGVFVHSVYARRATRKSL